ncbi:hypothetical protein IWW38_002402 [Coemansia aciculifera]|uniref:Uncharacterized protein n=1 Tax=Coemansia aciculifera TaxID=417176 RepID=A0ACC1M5I8_9FUNG|nr:hypothetical protein IWW38_002402 [Coemansia aciculifera]
MSAATFEQIRSALDGPSDCSFVHWLLDETEGACLALECVVLSLSGNYAMPLPDSAEQEYTLAIYEKLAASLADSASQDLARELQDKYILVGATLFDLAQAFGKTRPQRLRSLLASLCTNAHWLETEVEAASDLYMDQLVQFQDKYSPHKRATIRPSVETVCTDIELQRSMAQSWLCLIAFCQPSTSALLYDNRCIRELSKACDVATDLVLGLGVAADHMPSSGAKSCSTLVRELKWQWSSLAWCMLQPLLADDSKPASADLTKDSDSGCGVLFNMLNDMHTAEARLVPFYNAPLLLDMEFRFGLRRLLADASLVSEALDEAQIDYITMSIDQLVDMTDLLYRNGLHDLELRASQIQGSLGTTAVEDGNDIDAEAIQQVKELIPDLGAGFIRACLEYYGRSAEAVVGAIFEGNLPPFLAEMDRSAPHWIRPASNVEEQSPDASVDTLANAIDEPAQSDVLSSRRNIFDNDEFDIFRHNSLDWSRVQQGKSKLRTNLGAPTTEFKSRVMEIAQRIEEDDEYDDTYDHTAQDITASAIDAKDDVEASSAAQQMPGSKPRDKTSNASKDPIKPWEATLIRLYTDNPALFERKRETRNSPARVDLCTQTGLTHEQIEGWFIMFRRNPRHQQLVNRHLESNIDRNTNKSNAVNVESSANEGNGRRRAQADSANSGGQDFRRKDKQKAKIGNHNRKKQHARKVQSTLPPPM